jgi:hypothetical protein
MFILRDDNAMTGYGFNYSMKIAGDMLSEI